MAPELMEEGEYACKVDIYSLGVVIHEMAVGKNPLRTMLGGTTVLLSLVLHSDIGTHRTEDLQHDPSGRPPSNC